MRHQELKGRECLQGSLLTSSLTSLYQSSKSGSSVYTSVIVSP